MTTQTIEQQIRDRKAKAQDDYQALLTTAIETGQVPADAEAILHLAGKGFEDMAADVRQAKENARLEAAAAEQDRLAAELVPEVEERQRVADQWPPVLALIGREMAAHREAQYRGDVTADIRIRELEYDRDLAKKKAGEAQRALADARIRRHVLRQQAAKLRRQIWPLGPAVVADDAPASNPAMHPALVLTPAQAEAAALGLPRLETVAELMALSGMTIEQAGKTLGMRPWQVLAEIDSPGIVTTSGNWEDPRLPAARAALATRVERERAEAELAIEAAKAQRTQAVPAAPPQPRCPESVELLLEQGVPVEQIARMHELTPREVCVVRDQLATEKQRHVEERQSTSAARVEALLAQATEPE